MKASVIIPSHRSEATLPQTLRSLEAAARGLSVEIIVCDDPDGRGPSWARNCGLARATGEVVFFVDADDTVAPDFLSKPLAAFEDPALDLCFFTYPGGPCLEDRLYEGRAAVQARFLPAFFGYSFEDVRRWNRGGRLGARKEQGQVWRCAYRRSFLERHALRFDEAMTFYEDAAFLSSCAAFAARVRTLPDRLYCYRPRPKGNLASGSGSRRHWRYKFLSLAARKRLARATGGAVWPYCAASCVFSLLEMVRLWRSAGLARREAWRDFKIYLSDPDVGCALRRFPLSWRHPAVAAALCALRLLRRRVVAKTGSPDASGAPAGLSDEPAADLGDAPQGKAEEG